MKAQVPSFEKHPGAYGMKGKNAYWNVRRKNLVPASDKQVLLPHYDSTLIRPLAPVPNLEFKPAPVKVQAKPQMMMVKPEALLVDHNWQRELTSSSYVLLVQILENFNWAYYKTPNCIISPSGKLYVTDGQTTVLAAMHHPEIEEIPVLAVKVSEREFVRICAEAFISLNTVSVPVPRADRFTAQIAARHPHALKLADFFRKHKIKPIRLERKDRQYAARETMVISTFQETMIKDGDEKFDRLLEILSGANFSPIRRLHVLAIRELLSRETPKFNYDLERLRNAILSKADKYALLDAEINARRYKISRPMALANIYNGAYKKGAIAL